MAEKKYQVFISSTYSDLIEVRRKALDILLMADCIPAGMEAFVATDNEQFNVIKKVIDLCDYYVLIIGKRYGTINPDTGLSYTEMEYEYAKSQDIPVLVFAIDDSVKLIDENEEHDGQKIENLNSFRERAMSNRLASIWKTPDEFTGELAISIMRAKVEISRPGWQRATEYDEAMFRREIMELQKQNSDLQKDRDNAWETIKALTEQNDLAFDNCEIEIKYSYWVNKVKHFHSKVVKLPDLFSVISTEMMGVALVESTIENAITRDIFSSDKYFITDRQVIKRILNQLKALQLIYSFWSDKNPHLCWGLTTKGKKVRDDMILIRENKES